MKKNILKIQRCKEKSMELQKNLPEIFEEFAEGRRNAFIKVS